MFQNSNQRFATIAVASKLPDALIDRFWTIIDQNLQGVFPLNNVLTFDLAPNADNKVEITFSTEKLATEITFDTPIPYDASYPNTVLAYDDGRSQTILLPSDVE
ncbi:DUF960 domain-containing protein [Lapidilactobacillus wuchangensis]|uniref:DUF960 domain-containing protein n=1 Tax=Lapidilactobacillus wuchangensis TaxID=2486001 RepID=UPI000F78406E|nr:DUF960 domain-containing protein [Lapidilactobacillus wuchangensis]